MMKKIFIFFLLVIISTGILLADSRVNYARGYVTQWQAGPMDNIEVCVSSWSEIYQEWVPIDCDPTNENGYYSIELGGDGGAGAQVRITADTPDRLLEYIHTYSGSGDIIHNFVYHPVSGGD